MEGGVRVVGGKEGGRAPRPPKDTLGPGEGREGEVRLHRAHSDVHEGVALSVRRPVGGHASAPLSSSSSVVLVGRLLRPCSQVRWRCLAIVPCQHKLIGWKEAAMGGRRVAGGREGGRGPGRGTSILPQGPPLLPALPPLPKDLAMVLHHGRHVQPVVEEKVVETTRASARDRGLVESSPGRISLARKELVVELGSEQRLQPLLMGPGRIVERNRLIRPLFQT